MIEARKLDRLVLIQRRSRSINEAGAEATSWLTIAEAYAQRLEAGSRELTRAYGQVEEGQAVWRIRFVEGVTTSHRLLVDEGALDIVEVRELGRRVGLELRTRATKK